MDTITFNPPQMWCSDDDIHLRFNLMGMNKKVSDACVYHFVSKTSRKGNYQQIEQHSNKNFIRKWGASVDSLENLNPKVYDIGFVITNANTNIIQILEPWCSTLYVDYDPAEYIQSEQKNTKLDLNIESKLLKYIQMI
jgi:hypothetical protein